MIEPVHHHFDDHTHSKLDLFFVRYTDWLIRHRAWVLLALVVGTAIIAGQLRNAVFNADYAVFFSTDDPKVRQFGRVLESYTNNASAFYVITAKNGKVFSEETLEAVDFITEEAWNLPTVVRVDSLTNFQHARWEGDRFQITPLISSEEFNDPERLAAAEKAAIESPSLRNQLINETGSVTGVNVQATRMTDELVAGIREIRREAREKFPQVEIRLTGVIMLNNGFKEATIQDMATMTPIVALILMLTMAWLLRSVSLTIVTFVIIGLSTVSAAGVAVWLGNEISGPVAPAPVMIMTLAIANCIHILVTFNWHYQHGKSKFHALLESMRLNIGPVVITSVSTSIGFLSMTLKAVPPIKVMAIVTSLGVAFALIYSLTLLPIMVSLLPVRLKRIDRETEPATAMETVAEWVIGNRKKLMAASIAFTVFLGMFIPSIEFNNQFVNFLKERLEIRRDTDYAAENLTGIFQVTWSLGAPEGKTISDPAYLQKLDEFSQWLLAQEGVTHVSTVSNTIKGLNKLMERDDPAFYRIPDTQEDVNRLLTLYENSLPEGLSLRSVVTNDRTASRLIATTDNMRSAELKELSKRSEDWLRENAPKSMYSEAMGPWNLFADISDVMKQSMVVSTPLALVLVSLLLIAALRSVKFGIISLIPNLVPLVSAFGLWGLLDWDMDLALTGVMAMGIGIVVDDTVHFMSKYLRARREQGLDAPDAVRYAFASVGKALVVTSFVLIAGFITITFSVFNTSVNMGILTTLVITFALIGDLCFLPPLLIALDRGKARGREEELSADDPD